MCSQDQLQQIILQLREALQPLFDGQKLDMILFGSYARNQADDGSDIDILVLVDVPRKEIAEKNWPVGEIAAELLLRHGIMISPIVENRAYFMANADRMPFFRSILQEGVPVSA